MNATNKSSSRIRKAQTQPIKRFHAACTRCYQAMLRGLAAVKARVAAEFSREMEDYRQVLSASLNEAEAVAWQTPYPHLFFPVLAEEKAVAARRWALQQRAIRQRSNAGSVEFQLAA